MVLSLKLECIKACDKVAVGLLTAIPNHTLDVFVLLQILMNGLEVLVPQKRILPQRNSHSFDEVKNRATPRAI